MAESQTCPLLVADSTKFHGWDTFRLYFKMVLTVLVSSQTICTASGRKDGTTGRPCAADALSVGE